jgi:dihydroorotase
VDAIVAGLKDGTVDCIVSDHAPHTIFEKEQEFDYAPFGIIGLETLVPLAFTHLVKPGKLTVPQVVEKFTNGYKVLNIPFAGLKEGAKADVTVVDPSLEFEYKLESIVSKSRNSPFIGTRFTGAPVLTVVAGRVIMKDRKLTV